MATNVVVAASTATVMVNSVVYAKGVFGLGDSALALALGSYGTGSLLMALAVPRIVERVGVGRAMLAGTWVLAAALLAVLGVTWVAVSAATGWPLVLATWVLLGAGTSLINTPSSRLLAEASTPANRNLVYTAQFALSHICFLITYPIAGWLGAVGLTLSAAALLVIGLLGVVASAALYRRSVLDDRRSPRALRPELGR